MSDPLDNSQESHPAAGQRPSSVPAAAEANRPTEGGTTQPTSAISADHVMGWVLAVEGGLLLISLGLAWGLGVHDPAWPLAEWFSKTWLARIASGVLLAIPLLVLVLGLLPMLRPLQEFFASTEALVGPMFAGMRIWQIVVVALAAGVGEEFFFRWALQGGLVRWLPLWAAVSISAIVFGLCHWLNLTYFLLATLLGGILSFIYLWQGPLAVITCHAVYDLVAIRHMVKKT